MIVQTAAENKANFIITQNDHADVCGRFARYFGNEQFAAFDPFESMIHVVQHHDDGWLEIDGDPQLDPQTGLPYHLTQTPLSLRIAAESKSPDDNEAHHPYSGLISSMHTYGFYQGQYGLSDSRYIDTIDEAYRSDVNNLLESEKQRQARLKTALAANEFSAPFCTEDRLLHNYKLLQFFDALALFIQTTHHQALNNMRFQNVPLTIGNDTTVTAKHTGEGLIQLSPWPFTVEKLEVTTRGRYMKPFEAEGEDNLGEFFFSFPAQEQEYRFVAQ